MNTPPTPTRDERGPRSGPVHATAAREEGRTNTMTPKRFAHSLLVAATATSLPFLLSGCLIAALLLPSEPKPTNLEGSYRDEATRVELCGANYNTLAYLTVVREQYGDDPARYRFSLDTIILAVDPAWDGDLRNFARSTSWTRTEARSHDGVSYGSPYVDSFGRVDLAFTEDDGLVGSALLLNVPHVCDGVRVTGTATIPLTFGWP